MRQRHFMVAAAMVALLIAGAALAQSKEDKDRAAIKASSQAVASDAVHDSPDLEGALRQGCGLRGVRDDQGGLHRDGRRR